MAERLEVTVGANITELSSKLKQAEAAVKQFDSKGGQSLQNFAKGSNGAAFALTNFNRVVQDAPFGFIAIQNNLSPLLESFQQLKKESGSTGGAIKALTGSLMGAGGIGLAMSVITAGFTLAQVGLRAWGITADKTKESSDKLGESIKTLAEVQEEGRKNAAKEVSGLQTLYQATQNLTIPIAQRIKLVSELKKEYPDYFSQFSQEAILAGKAEGAYLRLTEAIKAKGLAQAGEKNRGIIINKLFDEEAKKLDAQFALVEANEKKAKLQAQFNATLDNQARTALLPRLNDIKDSVGEYRGAIKSADGEILNLNKSLVRTDALTANLVKRFGAGVISKNGLNGSGAGGSTPNSAGSSGNKTKAPEKAEIIKKSFADLATQLTASAGEINTINLLPFEQGLAGIAASMPQYVSSMVKTLEVFNEQASKILEGGLVNAFVGIGDAIGEALATGGSAIDTLGASLLSTLGSLLGQLGQMAIATGVAILGIKTALETLNPFVAIAAGVALLAISGVVKGRVSKMGSSMGGGSSGGFDVAQPKQSYSPSPGAANAGGGVSGGTVVFKIAGTDLIGVLNRAGGSVRRLGG